MIYVFDTSSLSKLKHFFPGVFKSVWTGLDTLVRSGELISTREVWNEIERGDVDAHTNKWLKLRKHLFTTYVFTGYPPCAEQLHGVMLNGPEVSLVS